MRVHDGNGAECMLVIHVPLADGTVHASVGTSTISLHPQDVSRLRQIYQEAQVVALQDRGVW